jgi:hypothetical protein
MNSTINVIHALNGMKPPTTSISDTPFEIFTKKMLRDSIGIGGVFAATVGILGFWQRHVELSPWMEIAMLSLAALALFLPLFAALLTTIAAALALWTVDRFSHLNFLAQIESDARFATILNEFPRQNLEQAKACIELRITRTRNWIGLLAGSPDKLTIVALLAMAFTAYTAISGKIESMFASATSGINWIDGLIAFVGLGIVASVVGMVLGAVTLHIHTRRYVYQLELLGVALASRD